MKRIYELINKNYLQIWEATCNVVVLNPGKQSPRPKMTQIQSRSKKVVN